MKSVTVQLPDDVYSRAERRAAERGATLSGEIVALVQRFSQEDQAGDDMQERDRLAAGSGLEFALQELAQVAQECSSSGWDGREAIAIKPGSVRSASEFLKGLPPDQPVPTIGAEPDGHITLEWHQDARRTLSISIASGPEIHYAALLGDRKAFGQELFLGEVPQLILELIQKIYAQ